MKTHTPNQDPEKLIQNLEGDKACSLIATCFEFWLKLKQAIWLWLFGEVCNGCGKRYDPLTVNGSGFCSVACIKEYCNKIR